MSGKLSERRVAILAADGFEQSELLDPRSILEEEGAQTIIVSLKPGEIMGWNGENWGRAVRVDKTVDQVSAEDFDALLLPGGVMNPDKLRMNEDAVRFAKSFFTAGKPVGAICHGPWLLIEADVVEGRKVTSWPSLKTDLTNAGAFWEDREVVVDEGLVTSRKPDDIPAFARKLIEEICAGVHLDQATKTAASLI